MFEELQRVALSLSLRFILRNRFACNVLSENVAGIVRWNVIYSRIWKIIKKREVEDDFAREKQGQQYTSEKITILMKN